MTKILYRNSPKAVSLHSKTADTASMFPSFDPKAVEATN